MVKNNVNSSQFKRKRKTIKMENIVILTSLSTTISDLKETWNNNLCAAVLLSTMLIWRADTCWGIFISHGCRMVWNSHLLLRLLSGLGDGGKESGGGNSARGGLKMKITCSFFFFFNIQHIYFPSAAHKAAQ